MDKERRVSSTKKREGKEMKEGRKNKLAQQNTILQALSKAARRKPLSSHPLYPCADAPF
jgi:hypothetical protein